MPVVGADHGSAPVVLSQCWTDRLLYLSAVPVADSCLAERGHGHRLHPRLRIPESSQQQAPHGGRSMVSLRP